MVFKVKSMYYMHFITPLRDDMRRPITFEVIDKSLFDESCILEGYLSGDIVLRVNIIEKVCLNSTGREYREVMSAAGILNFERSGFKMQQIKKGQEFVISVNKNTDLKRKLK